MDDRTAELLERLEALEAAIAAQIEVDKCHAAQLEKLIQAGRKENEQGLLVLAVLSFFLLVMLMGIRVEMSGFSFGVPVEIVGAAASAIAGVVFFQWQKGGS